MTNKQTGTSGLVEVTQADRDAAAGISGALYGADGARNMMRGDYDTSITVQAFARHRIAALTASRPSDDGEVERLREALVAISQTGIERDVKWAGMNAHDIARAALSSLVGEK